MILKESKTAIMYAREEGHTDIVEMINDKSKVIFKNYNIPSTDAS